MHPGHMHHQVPHYVPISAGKEWNFDELLEKIWEYLVRRLFFSFLLSFPFLSSSSSFFFFFFFFFVFFFCFQLNPCAWSFPRRE